MDIVQSFKKKKYSRYNDVINIPDISLLFGKTKTIELGRGSIYFIIDMVMQLVRYSNFWKRTWAQVYIFYIDMVMRLVRFSNFSLIHLCAIQYLSDFIVLNDRFQEAQAGYLLKNWLPVFLKRFLQMSYTCTLYSEYI